MRSIEILHKLTEEIMGRGSRAHYAGNLNLMFNSVELCG